MKIDPEFLFLGLNCYNCAPLCHLQLVELDLELRDGSPLYLLCSGRSSNT